jgi:hypothetical protein
MLVHVMRWNMLQREEQLGQGHGLVDPGVKLREVLTLETSSFLPTAERVFVEIPTDETAPRMAHHSELEERRIADDKLGSFQESMHFTLMV